MSVELRIGTESNDLECDWGVIEHGDPRPDRNQVSHLMIATEAYIAQLVEEGPRPCASGALHSVTVDGDRIFAHIDYYRKRWTWELFDAHFWDGKGPEIYVGRWPD